MSDAVTLRKTLKMPEPCLMVTAIFFLGVFLNPMLSLSDDENIPCGGKKRDPFVALVNPNGSIRTQAERCPPPKKPPTFVGNIILKAIIWDDKNPLALINNKVYTEGKEIAGSDGLIVQKIYPNSVVLNDNGNEVTIPLRKPEKK